MTTRQRLALLRKGLKQLTTEGLQSADPCISRVTGRSAEQYERTPGGAVRQFRIL